MVDLHKRLQEDTITVGHLRLCRVQLMNNATYPWVILVPMVEDATEIIDLAHPQQMLLMEEITCLSTIMKHCFTPHKLNVAALGNMVPQLHIHIIARYKEDPAWPSPIWNQLEDNPYSDLALQEKLGMLRESLQQYDYFQTHP